MSVRRPDFDEIGYWSEIKLDIVKEYAKAYSSILTKNGFHHSYIDGFAGAGVHLSKTTGELIPGSPLNALAISPPFQHHFLIDLAGDRVESLQSIIGEHSDVTVLPGDCNDVLLRRVFPQVLWKHRRRALCLLDPYGLHLNWEVIAHAGRMRSIDLFLNFPVMDMNRNALWSSPDRARPDQLQRMTAFWGDESWREVVYRPSRQLSLLDEPDLEKASNEEVVAAFRRRLLDIAGFQFVPEPIPMRNKRNAVVYYLFFASQKSVAEKIVRDIFRKHRNRRGD